MGNHIACVFQCPQLSFQWLPPPWAQLSHAQSHPTFPLIPALRKGFWTSPSMLCDAPPVPSASHRVPPMWPRSVPGMEQPLHTRLLQGWKAGNICVLSLNLSLRNETQRYVKQIIWGETWKEQMTLQCNKAKEMGRMWKVSPNHRVLPNVLRPTVCTCCHACARWFTFWTCISTQLLALHNTEPEHHDKVYATFIVESLVRWWALLDF